MERTASLLYEMYYKYRYKKSNIKEKWDNNRNNTKKLVH